MIIRLLLALAILAGVAGSALAQMGTPVQWQCGSTSTGAPIFCNASSANPLPVTLGGSSGAVAIGGTSSASVGITPVVGGSAINGLVLKNSNGNLYSVYAHCTAQCWLMVFNSITVPSNGSTTAGVASGNMVECVSIPINDARSISYGSGPPAFFSVGISAAISSTSCGTLTLSAVGFIHGMVQ